MPLFSNKKLLYECLPRLFVSMKLVPGVDVAKLPSRTLGAPLIAHPLKKAIPGAIPATTTTFNVIFSSLARFNILSFLAKNRVR
jgi:hypothetical protein